MNNFINTSEVIDTLALAEFDVDTESLKEVSSDSFVLAVSSKKFTIKRYYLIGELLYNNNITVKVSTGSPNYTASVLIGYTEFPRYSDFTKDLEEVSYDTSNYKFLNALPVDVLLESNTLAIRDCHIEIEIGVSK